MTSIKNSVPEDPSRSTEVEAELAQQIAELESTAKDVLQLKKDSRPKRPFIIEFCGSPKSGKSQAVTSLTIFLKRNGFSVRVLSERASVSPVTDKRSPLFNTWTGCSILTGLIPYLSEQISDVDVVVADRGIFDTLCWMTWLVDEGSMDKEEKDDMTRFFATKRFRQATDLVLAFVASPDASLEREYAHLLTRKFGSIMSPRVLESYVSSVDSTISEWGSQFKDVERIDTSERTQNQVAVDVTTRVLGSMREELVEKVGILPRGALEPVFLGQKVATTQSLERAGLQLSFQSRDQAELDDTSVQVVPVAVLTNHDLSRVMVFRKRRETLGAKTSPERDRNLLYVGGHMRSEDSFGIALDEVARIGRVAVQREMTEELGATVPLSDDSSFCIWDFNGQSSSQKHMALVHVIRVNFDELRLKLDGYELVQPHNSELSGQTVSKEQAAAWPPRSVESWSRAILAEVFDVSYNNQTGWSDVELSIFDDNTFE